VFALCDDAVKDRESPLSLQTSVIDSWKSFWQTYSYPPVVLRVGDDDPNEPPAI
jgi:hypothetical protein